MKRRFFITSALGALATFVFSGFGADKPSIRRVGKAFDYLKDEKLRMADMGDQEIIVSNADISGESFDNAWQHFRFVNCDFKGTYEQLQPRLTQQCVFENCRFSGVINFGKMSDVRFIRCQALDPNSILSSYEGSVGVVYEDCEFIGTEKDLTYKGMVGTKGEVSFLRCKFKYFDILAYTKLTLKECETEDIRIWSSANKKFPLNTYIENCKLHNLFDAVIPLTSSLSVLNSYVDTFNLKGSTDRASAVVQGDLFFENIKGGIIDLRVEEGAHSLIIRNSQLIGGQRNGAYAGAFQSVLIEDCSFGINTDGASRAINISGGFDFKKKKDPQPQPYKTQSIIFRRTNSSFFRSAGLNTKLLRIENCNWGSAELEESQIERLEIIGTTISRMINFTRTQAKSQSINLLKSPNRVDKLEGSNIKL